MKKFLFMTLAALPVTFLTVGCGGAPEVDPAANAEADAMEKDTEYEKEMMSEMSGNAPKE